MDNELAILGGKPIRNTYLPYGRQDISDEDIDAVVRALKSDFLTTGPEVSAFEMAVCDKVGSKYAVAFSNGTAALHAACFAADVKKGDEVITTPLTFAASANCALYMGAKPVFADVNKDNYLIDTEDIRRKITSNTKAIIPVDFTGEVVDIDTIMDIAKEQDLVVIQDAAHSLGSKYKDRFVGSIADMTMFSLHPVKTVTSGEGGIITTNNENMYEKLKLFRTHGITKDKKYMVNTSQGPWYYEQIDLGYNYRITDLQCALGKSQLSKLDQFKKRRVELVNAYDLAFGDMNGVNIQKSPAWSEACRHLYIISLELELLTANRNEIFDSLLAENIGVNVHYIPVYLHPYYQQLGYTKGLCMTAESLFESFITIPLFPKMSDDDQNDVINSVRKVINYYLKK